MEGGLQSDWMFFIDDIEEDDIKTKRKPSFEDQDDNEAGPTQRAMNPKATQ